MPLTLIRADVTEVEASAVVCPANPNPVCGGGTEAAIYRKAGMNKLLAARERIGKIPAGSLRVAPGFGLKAKYVFFTVGPVWQDGRHQEAAILKSCYLSCLQEAVRLRCESIVFPLLASGINGFPKDLALLTARQTISSFLENNELNVILGVYDKEAFRISSEIEKDITSYIDDHYVLSHLEPGEERRRRYYNEKRASEQSNLISGSVFDEEDVPMPLPSYSIKKPEAVSAPSDNAPIPSELFRTRGETFADMLFRMIDERDLKDSEVYKKANIDRKLFSKIRSNPDYHPKKNTVIAFCLSLHLDIGDARELLRSAGYAFSPANISDIIIEYCMEKGIYDVWEVNDILFRYDLPVLGG